MRQRRLVVGSIFLSALILAAIGTICILFSDKIVTLIAAESLERFAAETPTTTSAVTMFESMAGDMISRLRIVGMLLAIASVLVVAGRRAILSYLHGVATSSPPFVRALYKSLKTWLLTEDKIHLGIFLCIVVLAVALRLTFLFQPMRYDEAYTFNNFASAPLYIGLANYAVPNNHLFHTLLVHLATRFGSAEWLIRLPTFLTGILIVPATYAFGRRLHTKNTALLAAGLVACSSTLIEYSTNARGYTLVTLLFLLTFLLALALIRSRDIITWSLFVFFSVLGFFTIPTMLYGYSVIFVWTAASMWLCFRGQERLMQLRRLIIASVLVGIFSAVLYVPAYAAWGIESIVANKFVAPLPWADFVAGIPWAFSSIWSTWNRDIVEILRAILACGFVIGLFASKRADKYPAYLIVPVALFVCALILVMQRVIPFTRVWLFLLPLYAIFAAWGITYVLALITRRYANILLHAVAAIVCVTISVSVVSSRSIIYSPETGTLRDAKQITTFLSSYLLQNDKVYAIGPSDALLVYYFRRSQLSSSYIAKTADTLSVASRIVIVVNKTEEDTVDGMLDWLGELGIPTADYSDPQFLRSYETADLYLLTRR